MLLAAGEVKASAPAAMEEMLETGSQLEIRQESAAAYFTHRVRWPGETLISMARWYTGAAGNWRRLANANPDVNPEDLHIGDQIRIPRELIKTTQLLPAGFVYTKTSRKSKTQSVRKPVLIPIPEDPTLFGPIERRPQPNPAARHPAPPPLKPIE